MKKFLEIIKVILILSLAIPGILYLYEIFCTNKGSDYKNYHQQTKQKAVYDLIGNDKYFYYSDYRYGDFYKREKELIKIELNKLDTPLKANDFDPSKVKNEILIASIDSEFNIQDFIDKYSK